MSNQSRAQRARSFPRVPVAAIVTLLVIGIGAAIAIINARLVPASATTEPPLSTIAVGDTAPPFHVTTTAGTPFDSSKVEGPMVLEVFATWCPHCQHEVPLLSQLYRNDGRRAAFIAVSGSPLGMDHESPSSLEDVERFGQLLGVQYPIAYDADMDVAKKYLQNGYPTIVFVNRKKSVVAIESGEIPYAKLQADVNKAIGGHA